ncbi:MAG TPA: hypothetical protein EYH07_16020 [Kiloniellaceae bacterium]|nr:hypothetical protein [Kiloniellaceae bacterium]HIP79955.1 hypothetical protein [Kiloniellaceae bacterium]
MGTFCLGGWTVNPATRRISQGQRTKRLSPKALHVLTALVEAQGSVVARQTLLDRVWPEVTVGEEVLTQAIAELRRAFEDDARQPRFFETVHKAGYRLLRPARSSAGSEARQGAALPSSVARAQGGHIDLDAYARFLEACQAFTHGGAGNTHAAVAMFSDVVDSHPDYAPAYAGLARAEAFADMYYSSGGDHLSRAYEACERGLHIAPKDPELLSALGLVYSASGDTRRSYRSFQVALHGRPDCSLTHYLLGRACFAEGDFTLSAAMLEQAARLDQEDFHSLLLAAKARRRLGDARRARANLARAKVRIEDYLMAYPGDFRALCDQVCCLLEFGERDEVLDQAEALFGHSDPMSYYLVCFLARAGEVTTALGLLERVVEEGWSHLPLLQRDPDIDPLRGEAGYRRIEQTLEARSASAAAH